MVAYVHVGGRGERERRLRWCNGGLRRGKGGKEKVQVILWWHLSLPLPPT